jgi:hypothetical protein
MSDTPATQQAKPGKSSMAIAALIIGIVALILSAIPIINNFALVLAIVGFIFSIVGLVGIKKGKKSGMGIAIASLIISVIAAIVVIASQAAYTAALDAASSELDKATGDATEEVLESDVDVQLGEFSIKKDSYGIVQSELPVTITNLTDESASISIQIEAVDASGNRIDSSYASATNLGAGQSQTVKTFTYVSDDDYDAMKAATFEIVSASVI